MSAPNFGIPENNTSKQKRSSMVQVIALTALTSLALSGCAQDGGSEGANAADHNVKSQIKQQKDKDKEKEEQTTSASGHSSHGYHHSAHIGGTSVRVADDRSREYSNSRNSRSTQNRSSLSNSRVSISERGFSAPPSGGSGGISRGWFGRFFGSVFGG